ncbi:MAG: hypothetical protein Q8L09_04980 [Candidatus Moranbacteria bacterium]|nr:hypothetical protein [Candidatus Moranbacteria bacterium]
MRKKTLKKQGIIILKVSLSLILTLGIVFPYPLQTKTAQAANGQLIQTSQADFQGGAIDSALDVNQVPGDLRLKYKTESVEDTSDGDFNAGDIQSDMYMSSVSPDNGGKVIINQGYVYNQDTSPAIGNNNVLSSFLDSAHNLVYVSTQGGLSVLNTQGTVDPADDTLVKTYTTSTTPAIGNNYVRHSFLDSTHNLLYVSTYGGLSDINTQGTVDPADDTLVKT